MFSAGGSSSSLDGVIRPITENTYGNEIGTVIAFTVQYGTSGGWDSWLIFLIIGIGAVCTVVVVYRVKKSQKKKKKAEKPKESKLATGTLAERVKPKDVA